MSSFVIRDIEIDPFDPKSIENAIREVNDIRTKLIPAMKNLIETLTEKGVEIAKMQLFAFDSPAFDTGALHDSITSGMLDDETGVVATGVMYAAYVEYGTGWYASNGSGNEDGWVYYDTRQGRFRFTYGMPARPFMYNTFRSLRQYAEENGGRILAEYLK